MLQPTEPPSPGTTSVGVSDLGRGALEHELHLRDCPATPHLPKGEWHPRHLYVSWAPLAVDSFPEKGVVGMSQILLPPGDAYIGGERGPGWGSNSISYSG